MAWIILGPARRLYTDRAKRPAWNETSPGHTIEPPRPVASEWKTHSNDGSRLTCGEAGAEPTRLPFPAEPPGIGRNLYAESGEAIGSLGPYFDRDFRLSGHQRNSSSHG